MPQSPHTALAQPAVALLHAALPRPVSGHFKDLQSLLPELSRLELKSLLHKMCYAPEGWLLLPDGTVLSFKTVYPSDTTPGSTSISLVTPTQESSGLKQTNKLLLYCPHCDSTNLGDGVCLNCGKEIEKL